MTRTRRPRKPETVLRQVRGYIRYVGCGCSADESDDSHDPRAVTSCARAHFASLLSELHSALRERGKERTK